MNLPICPREDCTFTGPHHDHDTRTGEVRDRSKVTDCVCDASTPRYTRCYAPRTPQPQPATVVLPTVKDVRQTMDDAYIWHDAAQDVLDLIAARITPWKPIEPGTVIKAGTVTRIEWGDRDAREEVTRADYTPCQTDPARYYLDPRTVPAEPEDPLVAVVNEWLNNTHEGPADLLARLDAARADR